MNDVQKGEQDAFRRFADHSAWDNVGNVWKCRPTEDVPACVTLEIVHVGRQFQVRFTWIFQLIDTVSGGYHSLNEAKVCAWGFYKDAKNLRDSLLENHPETGSATHRW
jgi:hypothetical protein